MKIPALFVLCSLLPLLLNAQLLPGFTSSGSFDEQQMLVEVSPVNTRILINAPLEGFGTNDQVLLILVCTRVLAQLEQGAYAEASGVSLAVGNFV